MNKYKSPKKNYRNHVYKLIMYISGNKQNNLREEKIHIKIFTIIINYISKYKRISLQSYIINIVIL